VTTPEVLKHRDPNILQLRSAHGDALRLPSSVRLHVDDGMPGMIEAALDDAFADIAALCGVDDVGVAHVGDVVYIVAGEDVVIATVIARDWVGANYRYVLDLPQRARLHGGPCFRERTLIGVVVPSVLGTLVLGVDALAPLRQRVRSSAERSLVARRVADDLRALPLFGQRLHVDFF